ncbi:hypothetical protein L1049_022515 [Liquidambar formosana]|uniref:Uncharacterized protein n=1 Tax=Liquidambar formosana TaxID=63359 RepID=A0AAP0RCN3_LIQFO
MKKTEEEEAVIIWDCGSPLYDSFEIASLGHVIERHMMALPSPSGTKTSTVRSTMSGTGDGCLSAKIEGFHGVGNLNKFVKRNLWKRKMAGEKQAKAKRPKSGFYGLFYIVGFWKRLSYRGEYNNIYK